MEKNPLAKRAAIALAQALKTHGPESPKAFASWEVLYSKATGIPVEDVDVSEATRRLRRNAAEVWTHLRNMGLGYAFHPTNRGYVRACANGPDYIRNCRPRLERRSTSSNQRLVEFDGACAGDVRKLVKDPELGAVCRRMLETMPKLKSILTAIAMMDAPAAKAA